MKTKNTLKILGLLAVLAVTLPVSAETSTTTRKDLMKDINEKRMENRENNKMLRASTSAEIKTNRLEFKADAEAMKQNGIRGDIKARFEVMKKENADLREKRRTEFQAKREAFKTTVKGDIAKFKDGVKVKLDAAKKLKVGNRIDGIFAKLNAALTNLTSFDAKLEARIDAKADEGKDVSVALKALGDARISLDEAKSAVEAIKAGTKEAVTEGTEVSKEALKASIEKAHNLLKETRENYREVIKVLGESVKVEADAGAEAEVTN